MDAISFDYPLGPSKGYANRVLHLGELTRTFFFVGNVKGISHDTSELH